MPAAQNSDALAWNNCGTVPARGVPLLRGLLAQLGAAVTLAAYLQFAPQQPLHPLLVHGLVAGALGQAMRLPLWWLPINAMFVPSAVALQRLAIDPLWFLATFAGFVFVFWSTYRTRVPLFLSSATACARVAHMLPADATARMLDLGCGFGGVLLALRRLRPQACLTGFELAPLPAWLARLRARRDSNITVRRKDFWEEDFSPYDVVYAFLSPEPMAPLWDKVRMQMRPGSLFISNSFLVPDVPPDLTLPLSSRNTRALYVWRVPAA